jgi:competence protein ComEC
MLVDAGGTQGGGFDIGQHVIVPFLWHEWVRHLDVLALTHPQSDHIGGAPTILRMVSVGEVWTGAGPALSPTDLWIQEYLRRRRIPHRVVVAGDAPFRMGDAVIEVLHPDAGSMAATGGAGRAPRPNDRSLVLRVRLEDQAVLLTGDLERDGEAALLHSGVALGAQVIKVPHHGSRQSSTEAFLRAVGAQTAVLSVGHRNPFRHPHPEILARYQALGIRLWRTDRNGAVGVEMRPGNTRVWGRRGERDEPRAGNRGRTAGGAEEAPWPSKPPPCPPRRDSRSPRLFTRCRARRTRSAGPPSSSA